MILFSVIRPRIDSHSKGLFDGKLGIWSSTTIQEAAKRNLRNREKGTMATKAIQSIAKDVVKQIVLEKVTIKEK